MFMAETKDQKAIVLVTKTGMQFFGTNSTNILSLTFDPKFIRDLDVIDQQGLATQIYGFIDQNKIPLSPVLFIFAEPTCFYMDVKESDMMKLKALTEDFVNTVPFETLVTKTYKIKDGSRIVSINERIYREIAAAFEGKGFLSLGVVPWLALGARISAASTLDATSARQLLVNLEALRQQSFLASEAQPDDEEEKPIGNKQTQQPVIQKGFKITPALIGLVVVFIVLIGVLVFLLTRG